MTEMAENWIEGSKHTSAPASFSGSVPRYQTSSPRKSRQRNIFHLLSHREVSPRTKHQAKRHWSKPPTGDTGFTELRYSASDAKHDLFSWAESQSLHRWSAKYCPLQPPPRSTIAAAFSSDGKTLASTHGDHTVKIIDCQTGKCLKVLGGHRRTPWVVRYHPLHSDILASGSLDYEVRLWDANTSDCIVSHDFHRPIASIAFHALGDILAVASGHKLFIWKYNNREEVSAPSIILRTRRSLRAVHFHPHGAPYLLTAEVNNLDAADSQLTRATSTGYANYPPALFFANVNSRGYPHLESSMSSPCLIWPAFLRDDGSLYIPRGDLASSSTNVQQSSPSLAQNLLASDAENQQSDQFVTPMDICPGEPSASNDIVDNSSAAGLSAIQMHADRGQTDSRLQGSSSSSSLERSSARDDVPMASTSTSVPIPAIARPSGPAVNRLPTNSFTTSSGLDVQMFLRNSEGGNHHHDLFSDSRSWELPFLHGWLMAQNHTGVPSSLPIATGSTRGSNRRYDSRPHAFSSVPGVGSSLLGPQIDEAEAHVASLGVGSELTTSLFAAGAAELPCTVKLRVWRHDIKNPCSALETAACCLTISHAVLCSEMGAHFSPCGRFLVACVACMLPQTEGDQGSQLPVQYDSTGPGTSPTRHPLPSHGVIYELRVYSLEEATFGEILTSRAIRAAHCLTSIQFSPTSEHILLAYGRRHSSLLRSIIMDGETTGIPVYTILEVYRVSDMELIRVLPSAEDEVNVACFHPSPGGGLVYGTKEGKLRILQHNGADAASLGLNCFIEENMLEGTHLYAAYPTS
ncbi:uncharacterized protein LOC100829808 isoform X1 [Brachypodium distachyon]|uniref:uncharacterized protein LOC100829808 isoform X1 n=1 Tax=Brachypodium distachyon TaxID=15368 RepID=UPI000D0CF274|nr:uncharacterized protein LOC100829808 isoform X1 [Brachypodium distachyon]XP_024317057.1 uncharacterized protein LOC100829808 isoform X1 [Brachypodium distachyon]XP_024317058.1 uncharacterized protein LOC100829808 isoform X1 [Brachypodium distachyon]XP_024317059.1 uncharacterized protein LOC100829808 isoform X1 [Brachypodium distachyon]|eukprot:XP_024317056.1 uncharacterized protein LOC100829808 isoform X1 [Brachypodium distachyon]